MGLLIFNSVVSYNQFVDLDFCNDDMANRSRFLSRLRSLFLDTWTNPLEHETFSNDMEDSLVKPVKIQISIWCDVVKT